MLTVIFIICKIVQQLTYVIARLYFVVKFAVFVKTLKCSMRCVSIMYQCLTQNSGVTFHEGQLILNVCIDTYGPVHSNANEAEILSVRKKALQFSLNNFNKFKHNFTIFGTRYFKGTFY